MKTLLFLGASLLAACASPGDAPTTSAAAETRQVATSIFEAFNAHDWDKMESFYADSVWLQDPAYPEGKKGKTGMSEFYRSVPDIHDSVQRIVVEGNMAVVEFVSTGTINGEQFTLPICAVLTIENGQVIRDNTYYDATN